MPVGPAVLGDDGERSRGSELALHAHVFRAGEQRPRSSEPPLDVAMYRNAGAEQIAPDHCRHALVPGETAGDARPGLPVLAGGSLSEQEAHAKENRPSAVHATGSD